MQYSRKPIRTSFGTRSRQWKLFRQSANTLRAKLAKLSGFHWLALIFGLGLFLRLYERSFVEFYPDILPVLGAETLLFGHGYPFGYVGPIGPALLLLPFALTFHVLDYAQVIIAIFGSLLACLGYAICKTLLKDEFSGLFAALLITTDPFFVYVSRVLWIDSINSVLVLSSLLLFPLVVRANRPFALASYNALLLLTLLFKIYNSVLLPALGIWAILQWRTRLRIALQKILLCTSGAASGLLVYLYYSPIEVSRIITGARGSVVPIVGLKIDPLSEVLKGLTSFMFNPLTNVKISELSGQGYVIDGLPIELGLLFAPFIIYGAWSVWRNGTQKNLLVSSLIVVGLTAIVFTSFGGFHPRQIMTSRVIMISLFSIGAARLVRDARN
jgi:hypothetical protein